MFNILAQGLVSFRTFVDTGRYPKDVPVAFDLDAMGGIGLVDDTQFLFEFDHRQDIGVKDTVQGETKAGHNQKHHGKHIAEIIFDDVDQKGLGIRRKLPPEENANAQYDGQGDRNRY